MLGLDLDLDPASTLRPESPGLGFGLEGSGLGLVLEGPGFGHGLATPGFVNISNNCKLEL